MKMRTLLFLSTPFLLFSCSLHASPSTATFSDFIETPAFNSSIIAGITFAKNASNIDEISVLGAINLPAHNCHFYTNQDFSYANETQERLGHFDTSKGLYYLINTKTKIGFFSDQNALISEDEALATTYLHDDYSTIATLYANLKNCYDTSSSTAKSSNYKNVVVYCYHSENLISYSCRWNESNETTSTAHSAYLTFRNLNGNYVFSTIVWRQKITNATDGKSNDVSFEWAFSLTDSLPTLPFSVTDYIVAPYGIDSDKATNSDWNQPI